MTSDLPDLTITVPSTLRRRFAEAALRAPRMAITVGDTNHLPTADRLRIAADLLDPHPLGAPRYSPAPVEDEPNAPQAAELSWADQALVNGEGQATFTDRDGDHMRIMASSYEDSPGRFYVRNTGPGTFLTLEDQRRLHALLAANLAKHGAL